MNLAELDRIARIPLSPFLSRDIIGAYVHSSSRSGHVSGVSGAIVAIDADTATGWFGSIREDGSGSFVRRGLIDVRIHLVDARDLDLDLTAPSSRIALRRWMEAVRTQVEVEMSGSLVDAADVLNPRHMLTDAWWTHDRITMLADVAMAMAVARSRRASPIR